jgi:hypothetical protein
MDCFDIRTAYPLLLFLFDVGFSEVAWKRVAEILESYLLRRAVCGLSTKNYNRIFLQRILNVISLRGMRSISIEGDLTVEHLMPQKWIQQRVGRKEAGVDDIVAPATASCGASRESTLIWTIG